MIGETNADLNGLHINGRTLNIRVATGYTVRAGDFVSWVGSRCIPSNAGIFGIARTSGTGSSSGGVSASVYVTLPE